MGTAASAKITTFYTAQYNRAYRQKIFGQASPSALFNSLTSTMPFTALFYTTADLLLADRLTLMYINFAGAESLEMLESRAELAFGAKTLPEEAPPAPY